MCALSIACLLILCWILTVACPMEQLFRLQYCIFERPTALMMGPSTIDSQVIPSSSRSGKRLYHYYYCYCYHHSQGACEYSCRLCLAIGRGPPVPPAAHIQRPRVDPGPRPSRKMKSFFWDKLPENRLKGTFWQDRPPPYSALHVEEVCSLQHVTCTGCNGKMQACVMPNNDC